MTDPGGSAAKAFNASWRPRVYVLDPQGILEYVQPDTVLDQMAPKEVERLWRKSSQ